MSVQGPSEAAAGLLAQLREEADDDVRAAMATRYGIHTGHAFGVPVHRLKAMAAPLRGDHALAGELWRSGSYEARTIAALVDDPAAVDVPQMERWCHDFDSWAIVDTACFNLFDKAPDAWEMVRPWAASEEEFTKRAGFALLWALALHDRDAPDAAFREHLELVGEHASDTRPLVGKAITMAMRAVATKRPALREGVVALARELAGSGDVNAARVGRPIIRAFANEG